MLQKLPTPLISQVRNLFFALLVLLLPSQLGLHFWPIWSMPLGQRIDYLSPTLYLTDIVILLGLFVEILIYRSRLNRLPKISFKLLALVVAMVLFAVFNSYYSISPAVSVYKWLKLTEFVILFFWIKKNYQMIKSSNYWLIGLAIALFYESVLAWWQFLAQSSIGGIWYWLGERTFNSNTLGIAVAQIMEGLHLRPYGTFPHPNTLAGFLVVGTLVLLIESKLLTRLTRLVLILSFSTLLITLSRTGIILGTFSFGVLLLFKLRQKSTVLFLILLAIFLLTSLPILSSLGTEQESFRVRQQLNTIAIDNWENGRVIGSGLGTSPLYSLNNSLKTTNYSLYGQPPHNIYLLLLSEIGFPGLILIGLFVFLARRRVQKKYLPVIFFFLATGLFDHYWLTVQQGQLLLVLILALFFTAPPDKPH